MAAKKKAAKVTKIRYTAEQKALIRKANPHIFGGTPKEVAAGHAREERQGKVSSAYHQRKKAIEQANKLAAKGKASRKKRAKKN
jgi:hypothetical protein